jgi:hypothetical protein
MSLTYADKIIEKFDVSREIQTKKEVKVSKEAPIAQK